jgi:hypothetical protein
MSPQIISHNQVYDPSANENDFGGDAKISPNVEDMKHLAYILANISTSLDTTPEVALSIASKEMGWLFARDVPK